MTLHLFIFILLNEHMKEGIVFNIYFVTISTLYLFQTHKTDVNEPHFRLEGNTRARGGHRVRFCTLNLSFL